MYEGQPLLHGMGLASTDPPRLPCGSVGPMDVLVNWVPVGGEAWTITKDPFPLLWWRGVHRTQFRKQLSPCLDSSIQAIPHLWFLPSSWTPAHAPSSEAEIQNISDLSFDISFTHPQPWHPGWEGLHLSLPSFPVFKTFLEGDTWQPFVPPRHSRFARKIWPHSSWDHTWTFISSEINYSSVKPLETAPL